MVTDSDSTPQHSVLNSSFPVYLPHNAALSMSEDEFQLLIKHELNQLKTTSVPMSSTIQRGGSDMHTEDTVSWTSLKRRASTDADTLRPQKAPFIEGLKRHAAHYRTPGDLATENKKLTENLDVTNISSGSALVDLFYDLGDNTASDQLKTLLEAAWDEDSLLTLKLIFNVRSIHLGKSNRAVAYKALGWLAETHPLTLLANLKWLVRPVIAKKAAKKDDVEEAKEYDDFDMVDADEADPSRAHDVRFGVSFGYYKDLLNLVVFAANDQLKFDNDPATVLNQKPDDSHDAIRKRVWNASAAKALRQEKRAEQHLRVVHKLSNDPFYRALHTSVARLFAEQLKQDKALLDSGKKSDLKRLSLAAKWAPTFGEFHDKHTFIQSSIAEILYPESASPNMDYEMRQLHLRRAREHYRKHYASPLRKALSIVERDIAGETFENIKYDHVPSLAMDRYTSLFIKKDHDHFKSYIQDVANGTAKISGATLLPSTLVKKARTGGDSSVTTKPKSFKVMKAAAEVKVHRDVIDGQWNSLVTRIRESGTLQSSIAVCDVSGSMYFPQRSDGSTPMDSAIGLSLLVAEITAPPFGDGFITFSGHPSYVSLSGGVKGRGLAGTIHYMIDSAWGMDTNFVAVFEDVILPMAVANKLTQDDMVKQVFVFSDMQFNAAEQSDARWTSSYDRIKKKYAEAGYEMPRLIFWNLAAQATDKPVTMDDQDTALVSGYSQGMLRAFLESGVFESEEEESVVEKDGDEEVQEYGMVDVSKVKKKIDPLHVVKKAVSHAAYEVLEVVD